MKNNRLFVFLVRFGKGGKQCNHPFAALQKYRVAHHAAFERAPS